jgi:flagellar hook assembly protein FlgD
MEFTIPEAGNVSVQVYNLKGQVVSTLLSGHQMADTYNLTWDASQTPSGIYFIKAQSAEYIQTQKLMLIK